MTQPRWKILAAIAAIAVGLPAVTNAQMPSKKTEGEGPTEARAEALRQRTAQRWLSQLERIEGQILAGKSRKAYRASKVLSESMMNSIRSGEDTGMALALATVMRALAAASSGDEMEALWHWQVAQQLFPEINQLKLEPYGEAGELLERNPAKEPLVCEKPSCLWDQGWLRKDGITPPKKKRAPYPQFPRASQGRQDPLSVILQVVINSSGIPTRPVIVKSNGELTMVYSALEAFRHWRFRPALADGKPTSALYNLTINYLPRR
ncbi:MAG: energy transducer TonB [Deltaproteobacteria bacterium]|nr:energy transducer TonB [Deltaproteobacteria bacterium]